MNKFWQNIGCGALFGIVATAAQAIGIASVTCGSAAPGVFNNGMGPILNISYSTGADAGAPGLFWLGVLSPDHSSGAVRTEQGWAEYHGGLYPFEARYDDGFPSTISLTIPFPGGVLNTAGYVGYGVYVGDGAYTAQAQQKVADRRLALNNGKESLVASGTWSSEYDSDERFIWSLIQKNMVDNQKFGVILVVPFVDCAPLGG